jgi:hypothetical protein
MADDRYDQLLQIQQNRQYAAHQRLVQGLESQRQANWQDYCQAISENNMDAAAFAESEYLKHTRELAEMTGRQAAQQQRAPQQQAQPQQAQALQQFYQQHGFVPTEGELRYINDRLNVWSDPEKRREMIAAANSLALKGYNRNSDAYFSAIDLAVGLTGPDGRDGPEIASPETALEAVNNSQIARKYGPVTPDDYRQGMARLVENKKLGLYEVDR